MATESSVNECQRLQGELTELTGPGNTVDGPSVGKCQHRTWSLTLNLGEKQYTPQELISCFELVEATKYVFQLEQGANGNMHYQGTVTFKNAKTLAGCKRVIPTAHWEPTRSALDSSKYCNKNDATFRDGPWSNIPTIPYRGPHRLRLISEEQMYDWQKDVVRIAREEPDDRSIFWFWENRGGSGKTAISKFLVYHYKAVVFRGKTEDILHFAANNDATIYVMNIPRQMKDHVNYGAIEALKDGLYMTGKYEGKMVLRPSPHIFVFANFPPEVEALSMDRWQIKEIDI